LSDPAAPTPTPSYSATTQPNANYWETTTARLALKWKVNDALTISPSVYYQRLQIHDTAAYWMPLSDTSNGVFRNGNALTNPSNDSFTLSAVKLQWDMGFAQLFSNTAFYDRNQNAQSDYTQYLRATWASFAELPNTFPAAGDQGFATFEDNQRNFYQEVRLASSDANSNIVWNAGVFFSHLKESVPESIYDKTLDQEVSGYFESPRWSAGATKGGVDFVNVSGILTYQDRPAAAILQFVMYKDKSGFKPYLFTINGVPQPLYVTAFTLAQMCE